MHGPETPAAFLKRRAAGRIAAGHPWLYKGEIERIEGGAATGCEIDVRDEGGRFVGRGIYNGASSISVRIFSRVEGEALDEAFLERRLRGALRRRASLFGVRDVDPDNQQDLLRRLPETCRLVWSEADLCPGLVIDRYGDACVIQTLSIGVERWKGLLTDLLVRRFGFRLVVERNDVPVRRREGLDQVKGILTGDGPAVRRVRVGSAVMEIDLMEGQKTGAYLDQVESYGIIRDEAGGRRVLDAFCYQGAFAIHAALGGAESVLAVDMSEEALNAARRNAEINGVVSRITWKCANVFDFLHAAAKEGGTYDLIVLDPPSFTRSKDRVPEAARGYKEINLRALSMLREGGLLATFCCSHHVDADVFRGIALDAAFDAGKQLLLRRVFRQAPDHPILPAVPETEYLKGFLFEVMPD